MKPLIVTRQLLGHIIKEISLHFSKYSMILKHDPKIHGTVLEKNIEEKFSFLAH